MEEDSPYMVDELMVYKKIVHKQEVSNQEEIEYKGIRRGNYERYTEFTDRS